MTYKIRLYADRMPENKLLGDVEIEFIPRKGDYIIFNIANREISGTIHRVEIDLTNKDGITCWCLLGAVSEQEL
jgi:hypothetical protein